MHPCNESPLGISSSVTLTVTLTYTLIVLVLGLGPLQAQTENEATATSTAPRAQASFHPKIERLPDHPGNPSAVRLHWNVPSDNTRFYQIDASYNLLKDFTPYTLIVKRGGQTQVEAIVDILSRSNRYFYRITEYPNDHPYLSEDSDLDGLSNRLEANLNSNPFSRDTDQDNYYDLTEYTLGSNPLDAQTIPYGFFSGLKLGLSDLNLDDDIWKLTITSPRIRKIELQNNNPSSVAYAYVQLQEGEEIGLEINRVASYEKFTDEYKLDIYGPYGDYPPVVVTQETGDAAHTGTRLSWSKWHDWSDDNETPPDPKDKWRLYAPLRGLKVSDPDGSAGERSSSRKIVKVRAAGSTAPVEIQLTDRSGRLPAGYPKWSDSQLAHLNGQNPVLFTPQTSSTLTLFAEILPDTSTRPITIEVVDENKFEANWDFDSEHFQSLQKAINTVLAKIGDTELNLSGTIAAEFKRVDYYNDPARYGHAARITGSLSASFPDIGIESPRIPVPYTPAYVTFAGGFQGTKITLSTQSDFNQSRRHPGRVYGTLAGQTTGTVEAKASVNLILSNVSIKGKGSTTFSTSGSLDLHGKNIVVNGSVGVSDLTAAIIADAIVDDETFEKVLFEHIFDYAASKSFSSTIYTFQ